MRESERDHGSEIENIYYADIHSDPTELLSHEQEVELSKIIEAGVYAQHLLETNPQGYDIDELQEVVSEGEAAFEHFLKANLRLVLSVAHKNKWAITATFGFTDIIQEGNIGLMRAVRKFDYAKGKKFSTYATWWIKQSIQRARSEYSRRQRLPVEVFARVDMVRRVSENFISANERDASIEELVKLTGLTVDQIEESMWLSSDALSFNDRVGENEELADVVPSRFDVEEAVIEAAFDAVLKDSLRRALSSLSARERRILHLRHGISDGKRRGYEEVGKDEQVKVGKSRVHQIEVAVLARIKKNFPELAEYFLYK